MILLLENNESIYNDSNGQCKQTMLASNILQYTISCYSLLFTLFVFEIHVHTLSHTWTSVLLMLLGDSCIVHQATFESGSRWASLLSLLRQLLSGTHTQTHTQKARGILISIPLCHQFTTQSIYLSFLYRICEQLPLSCCAPPLPSTFEEQRYSDRDSSMIVWFLYPFALLVTAPSAAEGFTVSFWLKAQLLSCQTLVFSCHSN